MEIAATLLFLGRELGTLAIFLATAYVLGALALGAADFESRAEAVSFRAAAGFGVVSLMVLALALAHSVQCASLLAATAAIVAGLAAIRRRKLVCLFRLPPRREAHRDPAMVVILVACGFLAIRALYPPTDFDALMYHLPSARLHIAENRLAWSPDLHLNFMPQAWELLYTAALLVGRDTTAQLLHATSMALIALGAFAAAGRSSDGRAAGWAGALWLASPVVASLATSAYVDVGLTLFVFVGVIALGRWNETVQPRWLVIGAFFLGLAASTKYIGLVFCVLAGAGILISSLRLRRLAPIAIYTSVSFAVFLPWLVRTWTLTATPFGYFWGGVFGYGRLDPFDAVKLAAHMRAYGYPRTPGNFLATPWNLFFHSEKFLEPTRITPLLALGIPFAGAAAVLEKRTRWLLGSALAYFVVWFLTYQNPRFLLPVFPMLAVGVAVGLDRALRAARLSPAWQRVLAVSLTILILLPALVAAWDDLRARGPIPSTDLERRRFLEARVPGYGALDRLNSTLGDRYAVYGLFLPSPVYYARGRFVGDWFGPDRFETVLPFVRQPRELHARLRSIGMTHLAVAKQRFERVTRLSYERWRSGLGELFRPVYDDESVEVFELPETSPAPRQ